MRRSKVTRSRVSEGRLSLSLPKPPLEGRRNKNIQAIVSPPIRSKASSQERSQFIESMVSYLKSPTAENCEKLYRSAYKLLLKSVGTDPRAAEIAARVGQDRELMVNLLNRLEENLAGLDVSPQAWQKVRFAIFRGADLITQSPTGSSSTREGRHKRHVKASSWYEDSDSKGKHDEEGDETISSTLDENNAYSFTSGSTSKANEANNNKADTNNARIQDPSPESSDQDEGKPGETTGVSSATSGTAEDDLPPQGSRGSGHRFGFDDESQKAATKRNSMSGSDTTNSTFGRSTVISGAIMNRMRRSSKFLPDPAAMDSDQEVCVIWDDEEDEGEDNALCQLAQDLEGVFQQNEMYLDFLTGQQETPEDTDEFEGDEEEAQEAEDMFKSEFRHGHSRLSTVELSYKGKREVAFTRVSHDEDGREYRRANFDSEEQIINQIIVDEERKKFTCVEYDKAGNELLIVQFDENGKELHRTAFGGSKKQRGKFGEDFLAKLRSESISFNTQPLQPVSDDQTPIHPTAPPISSLTALESEKRKVSSYNMVSKAPSKSLGNLTRGESSNDVDNQVDRKMSSILNLDSTQIEYERWVMRENKVSLAGAGTESEDDNLRSLRDRATSSSRFNLLKRGKKNVMKGVGKWKTVADSIGTEKLNPLGELEHHGSSEGVDKRSEESELIDPSQVDASTMGEDQVARTMAGQFKSRSIAHDSPRHSGEDLATLTQDPNKVTKPADKDGVTQYLASHGIYDLFQFMMTNLIIKQPEKPIDYLINMTRTINENLKIRGSITKSMIFGTNSPAPKAFRDKEKKAARRRRPTLSVLV